MLTFQNLFADQGTFQYLSPYIIAEVGVNHANSMDLAKQMIREVAEAGGHCVKFQTYKADKIAAKKYAPSYWDLNSEPCTSQHELFTKYDHFGEAEYAELAKYCVEQGVDFLSTPFDNDAAVMLSPMMKFFKIASADVTNIPLLRVVGAQKKPVLMSTGAATLGEVETAIDVLYKAGATDVALMHCVLNYPTPKENAQMSLQDDLMRIFGGQCDIGYSDHVAPNDDGQMPSMEMATINGAVVLEKHYTYDKTLSGNDHYHAMDKNDLAGFMTKLGEYQALFGGSPRQIELEAQAVSNARRRIIAKTDIKAGEILSEENMIALRSNTGVDIKQWDEVLGKVASVDIPKDEPVSWGNFTDPATQGQAIKVA